jgi:WD40 repeat protein
MAKDSPHRFVAGGAVQAGDGIYVPRDADRRLYDLCRRGVYTHILTSRQVGKSSLIMAVATRLAESGCRFAILDLGSVGGKATEEQWYKGLLVAIADQLAIRTDASRWWSQNSGLPIAQRFVRFLTSVVLREIHTQVVIFVDEIDTTLQLPFTDDFFIAVRSLSEGRARSSGLRRLSFVLSGVATPNDLIKDKERTPYNLGEGVELRDFSRKEVEPLVRALRLPPGAGESVLERILDWTGGHPYLTLRILRSLEAPGVKKNVSEVDRIVRERFLTHHGELPDSNLRWIQDMLRPARSFRPPTVERRGLAWVLPRRWQTVPKKLSGAPPEGQTTRVKGVDHDAVLRLYVRIRRGSRKGVRDNELDRSYSWLKLSGIAQPKGGLLEIRNRIYSDAFPASWARRQLRIDWPRRLAQVGTLLLILTFLGSLPLAIYTVHQGSRVQRLKEIALSRGLTARAVLLQTTSPNLIALTDLLAVEALRRDPNPEAQQVLHRDLPFLPKPERRFLHSEGVMAVSWSPDGKNLLGLGRGQASLWDPASGLERLRFSVNANGIGALSSDGRFAAIASQESKVDVFEIPGGNLIASIATTAQPSAVAFSPDGRFLAVGDRAGTVFVLAGPSFAPAARFAHAKRVGALAFSSRSPRLITGSDDGTAKVWSLPDGRLLADLRDRRHPLDKVTVVALNAWGQQAWTGGGSDATARSWSVTSGKEELRLAHGDRVTSIALDPLGDLVLVGSADGSARLWNGWNGAAGAQLKHQSRVLSVAWSADGARVATGSADFSARVWSRQGQELMRLSHSADVPAVAFGPGGRIATGSADHSIEVWRPAPAARPPEHEQRVAAVAFSPAGMRAASAGFDGSVYVWDVATGKRRPPFRHSGRVYAVTLNADGRLALTGSSDKTARLWDVDSNREILILPHSGTVSAVDLSDDARWIATGSQDNVVRVWDRDLRREVFARIQAEPIEAIALDPTGDRLLAGGTDNRAYLWDRKSGEPTLLPHGDRVVAVAFSPSGDLLATGSYDSTACLWDGQSDRPLQRLQHGDRVFAVAFLSDTHLGTASWDGTVRIWDVPSGLELVRFFHRDRISALAFHPDERRFLVGMDDGLVRMEYLRSEDLVANTCQNLPRNLTQEEWREFLVDEPYRKTCEEAP